MSREQLLFEDYRYYRKYTKNVQDLKQKRPYLRELKPTKDRLRLFKAMDTWCKEKQFDSRMWLYSLFVARRWRFAPKIEVSNLLSEKHITRFQKLDDFDFFRKRLSEQERLNNFDSGKYFDPNRDLSGTAESAKEQYQKLNQIEICMASMETETFGYHPKSSVCKKCVLAMKCYQKLQSNFPFDVIALRLGQITSRQARQQALACEQGYNNAKYAADGATG
jgi:hypothetical protein